MRRWAVRLAVLMLILSSCSQGDWAPVSSSLEERISARSVEDVLVIDSRALVLTLALPVEDSYSFSLTDPDGLEWEGSLTPDGGGFYASDELTFIKLPANLESFSASMLGCENLQEIEDEGEIYESIEDIWPDYPSKDDFFFNEEEY